MATSLCSYEEAYAALPFETTYSTSNFLVAGTKLTGIRRTRSFDCLGDLTGLSPNVSYACSVSVGQGSADSALSPTQESIKLEEEF